MTRILTAAVGIPLVLAVIYWGSEWLFGAVVALVAALALDEFLSLRSARGVRRPGHWFLLVGVALSMSFLGGPQWTLGVLFAGVVLLTSTTLGTGSVSTVLDRMTDGVTGLVYTCFLLGFLILLSRPALIVLFGIVWAGDTAAYYGGRAWGRHRLAPRISPNKTLEGAIAGALASVLVGTALGGKLLGMTYAWLAMLSLVTAIVAQIGDLCESAVKRSAGVKDSSQRLPGHGGVLDRVDSLLFAGPVFYFLLRI